MVQKAQAAWMAQEKAQAAWEAAEAAPEGCVNALGAVGKQGRADICN